jgi:hypothetical protein
LRRGPYVALVSFRVLVALAAVFVAGWAAHELRASTGTWLLAVLFAGSASVLFIRPMVVPTRLGSAPYSLGPSFLLASMFLLPAGPLVAVVAFSISLAGVYVGERFHRLFFNLSLGVVVYGGTSLLLRLAPNPVDVRMPYLTVAGVEALLAASVLVAQLLFHSIAMRLARGAETPHWGAFRSQALIEGLYCVALAVTISLLTRLHPALLVLVYAEIGIVMWFLSRYRRRLRDLSDAATARDPRRWAV